MNNPRLRSLPVSICLDDKASGIESVPSENQIMRVGMFEYQGKDLPITSQMLASMVKNFNENVRGIDIAVDYKHASDDIAAGWIKKLYTMNEGRELWATISWNPNGKKILSDKEFRYLSADFVLNYVNNETKAEFGPTLLGAGLTNRPFIKGMEPVVELSEKSKGNTMDPKDKQIADLQAQVEELKKQIEQDVQEDAAGDEGDKNMADLKKMCADLKAENDGLKKKQSEIQAAADKANADKVLAEKKGSFDKMLSEGKVVEAQREAFMSNDMIKFSENAGKVNLSGAGSAGEPAIMASSAEQAQDAITKLAEKKLKEKDVKSLSEGISKALMEQPELRKQIYGN